MSVARADILERLPSGGWRMIEVKSTTRVKEVFIRDTAIQLWILRGAGMDVRDVGILTLNNQLQSARTPQRRIRTRSFDCTTSFEWTEAALDTIGDDVQAMHDVVALRAQPPQIETGAHCHSPYPCTYWAHCTRELPLREHPLDELPRLRPAMRAKLDAQEIVESARHPAGLPDVLHAAPGSPRGR